MQPRLRSLYQYTMCKRITEPVARTVGVSSELDGSLSGIGRLAAQPPLRESRLDECSDTPGVPSPKRWSVLKEASVRIRRKGAFLAGAVLRKLHRRPGRSLSMANADLFR